MNGMNGMNGMTGMKGTKGMKGMMSAVDPARSGVREEDEIYRENILDHYKHPRNFGAIADASFSYREFNPVCGDRVEVFVKFDRTKRVVDVRFVGAGCAISQAAASMLTDHVKGKTVREIQKMGKDDILKLLGISLGAVRLRCALLSLNALEKGIIEWREKDEE